MTNLIDIDKLPPAARAKLGAQLIGGIKSKKKSAAARRNGKKGGRPKLKKKSK